MAAAAAPSSNFIGLQLDAPFRQGREKLPWVTNVDKLADGGAHSEQRYGNAWRKVIVDGLNQTSVGAC